jgi:uncharacterized Zn finger protein
MSQFKKSAYAPCPSCGAEESNKVGFTWWGGFVGPAMLSHVRCGRCGSAYNGKTGQSNTVGIIIYMVVGFVIVLGLMILVAVLNAK